MLTEREIEQFGFGNERIFYNLETKIIEDIVRRIKKTKEITETADFQLNRLRQLGYSTENIKDMLTKALGASDEYIDKLYEDVLQKEYIINKNIYKELNKEFIKLEDNGLLINFLEGVKNQTKDTMKNMSQSMGFVTTEKGGLISKTLTQYYQDKIDEIITDITLGTFDYNSTLRKAVNEMTNSGVRFIDYASGRSNRITVAARRSVMTGIAQITGEVVDYNANKLNAEYFEVSAHAGARPEHAAWQGKVYTKEELTTICGLGSVTGLLGANCYHTYYPFFPGLSERAYTDEELKKYKLDRPKVYKGEEYTQYEALQLMRRLETTMRSQREKIVALKAGGASEDTIRESRAKYRVEMAEYKHIAKFFDLKEQKERIYIDGLGRV